MTIIFFQDPNHANVSYIQREAVSKSILHPSQSPWSGQTAFESQVAIHTGEREALPHPSLLTMAHFFADITVVLSPAKALGSSDEGLCHFIALKQRFAETSLLFLHMAVRCQTEV